MIYVVDLYVNKPKNAFITSSYRNDDEIEEALKENKLDSGKKYIYIKFPDDIDYIYRECKIGYLNNGVVDLGGSEGSSLQNEISFYTDLTEDNKGPKYSDSRGNILLNYTERHELKLKIKVYKSEDYEHREKGKSNGERLHFLITLSTETNSYIKEKKKFERNGYKAYFLDYTCGKRNIDDEPDFENVASLFDFLFGNVVKNVLKAQSYGLNGLNMDIENYALLPRFEKYYPWVSSYKYYMSTYKTYTRELDSLWDDDNIIHNINSGTLLIRKNISSKYLLWNIARALNCEPLRTIEGYPIFVMSEEIMNCLSKYSMDVQTIFIIQHCVNNFNEGIEALYLLSDYTGNEIINNSLKFKHLDSAYMEKCAKIMEWLNSIECYDEVHGINRVGKDDSESELWGIKLPKPLDFSVNAETIDTLSCKTGGEFVLQKDGTYIMSGESSWDVGGHGRSYDKNEEFKKATIKRIKRNIFSKKKEWIESHFLFN